MWDYWSLFLRRKISEAESKKSSFTLSFLSHWCLGNIWEYISKSAVNLGITYQWVIISIIYTFYSKQCFSDFHRSSFNYTLSAPPPTRHIQSLWRQSIAVCDLFLMFEERKQQSDCKTIPCCCRIKLSSIDAASQLLSEGKFLYVRLLKLSTVFLRFSVAFEY